MFDELSVDEKGNRVDIISIDDVDKELLDMSFMNQKCGKRCPGSIHVNTKLGIIKCDLLH